MYSRLREEGGGSVLEEEEEASIDNKGLGKEGEEGRGGEGD